VSYKFSSELPRSRSMKGNLAASQFCKLTITRKEGQRCLKRIQDMGWGGSRMSFPSGGSDREDSPRGEPSMRVTRVLHQGCVCARMCICVRVCTHVHFLLSSPWHPPPPSLYCRSLIISHAIQFACLLTFSSTQNRRSMQAGILFSLFTTMEGNLPST